MQECVALHHSSGRIYNQIEKTRIYLKNLDHPSFKTVKNSLLQEIRSYHSTDRIKPNQHIMMLPGTTQNHHSCGTPDTSASHQNSNANRISSLFLNDIDTSSDVDDYVANYFRTCNNNRGCNNNSRNISRNNNNNYQNNKRNSNDNYENNQRNNGNIRLNASTNDRLFRGKFYACGKLGHRAGNCKFIKKLMSCLKHV